MTSVLGLDIEPRATLSGRDNKDCVCKDVVIHGDESTPQHCRRRAATREDLAPAYPFAFSETEIAQGEFCLGA